MNFQGFYIVLLFVVFVPIAFTSISPPRCACVCWLLFLLVRIRFFCLVLHSLSRPCGVSGHPPTHTYTHTRMCAHTYTHKIHTRIHTHTHSFTHTHIHTYTHTHTRTHTHKHTRTRTHTTHTFLWPTSLCCLAVWPTSLCCRAVWPTSLNCSAAWPAFQLVGIVIALNSRLANVGAQAFSPRGCCNCMRQLWMDKNMTVRLR